MPAAKKVVRRAKGRLDRAAQQKREKAIIADLKAGKLSYREIAHKHGVSLPTVNAKARKANIRRPRGRRRVAVPVAAKPVAPRRRGRPRKAKVKAVPATVAAPPKKARRPGRLRRVGRRPAVRRPGRPSKASGFMDTFRKMVMAHFPNLTLRKYDRLVRIMQKEAGV